MVFGQFLDLFVIVIIDDIFVYSKSEVDHEDYLFLVLQTLKDQSLYAKLSKCEFWLNDMTYIGYVVSSIEIMVDPQKVVVVKKCPTPMTSSDIWSFLGLTSYYRIFVKSFSSIASLLTKLTQKKVKFLQFDNCEGSFENLKNKFPSALVFTLPKGMKDFVIYQIRPKWDWVVC